MSDCPQKERNMEFCNCTYEPCPRKGRCCECVHYHREKGELPGCFFPDEVESTYDRSFRRFAELRSR
ncbi:MAG: DUF6485 family protein [Methanomassiliicoccales archaeon]